MSKERYVVILRHLYRDRKHEIVNKDTVMGKGKMKMINEMKMAYKM